MSPFVSTPLGKNKPSTWNLTNVQLPEYPCRESSLSNSQSLTARTAKPEALPVAAPWTTVSRTRTKRQNRKKQSLHSDKTFRAKRSVKAPALPGQVGTLSRGGARTKLSLADFLRSETASQLAAHLPSKDKPSGKQRKRQSIDSRHTADISGLLKVAASHSSGKSPRCTRKSPASLATPAGTPSLGTKAVSITSSSKGNCAGSQTVSQSSPNRKIEMSRDKVLAHGEKIAMASFQPSCSGATVVRQTPEKTGDDDLLETGQVYMADAPKYHGLCGTALCQVMNPVTGRKAPVRILLDSGANMTMLNKHVARTVGLTGQKVLYRISVAGGGVVSHEETEVVFQLVNSKGLATPLLVGMTTEAVGNPFQPVDFNPKKYPHLKDLVLADKFPNPKERSIELLLAEPYYSMFQKDGTRVSDNPALPMAQETSLGWVLRGATGIHRRVQSGSAFSVLSRQEEVFDLETMYKSLAFDFRKFWDGENIGLSAFESMTSEHTALEIQAIEFHKQHAHFDSERKKWSVHLPWIMDDLEAHRMTDNTRRAKAFYFKMIEKLKPGHLPLVREAYADLVEQEFAEEVPVEEYDPPWPTYVMTSRPVFRLDKATTKCRIVINASMVDPRDTKKSLNKLLMPGPNMLPQIMELVMRLMFKKFIFLIDIKKMVLAVELSLKSDRDMLRYLWGEPGSEPKLYRLRALGFGIISSPFQAMRCLQDTAVAVSDKYPEAAESIAKNTYMDDTSDGHDSLEAATNLLRDILTVMESGDSMVTKFLSAILK